MMELKNRIAFAPMGYGLDGKGPLAQAYFEARVRGGAGHVRCEAAMHFSNFCK